MTIDTLREIMKPYCRSAESISLESRIESDLNLCSFDMMVIVSEIAKKTGESVDLSDFSTEMTVDDLLNNINRSN